MNDLYLRHASSPSFHGAFQGGGGGDRVAVDSPGGGSADWVS